MLPAHQRLDAGDLSGVHVDLGLKRQAQFLVLDGAAQLAQQRELFLMEAVVGGVRGGVKLGLPRFAAYIAESAWRISVSASSPSAG